MTTIPQFRLPLTVAIDGSFQVLEQDGPAELAQRVAVLVMTPPGTVPGAEDFGLYRQEFLAGGADVAEVERQLATYVPEAETLIVEDAGMLNEALDPIRVQVSAA